MQMIPSGIKNCALVEKVASLCNEINHGIKIRVMNDKFAQTSSDLANLSQANPMPQ